MAARSKLSLLVVIACAAAVAGCNGALVGTWKADPMPKDDAFAIQQVTFKSDNTYTATAKEGDQSIRLAGTYDFNGMSLKLKTPGKPDHTYGAMVVMGKTLELKKDNKKVSMKKQ
ncbi:MAG TPA: hypothetical protein VMV81_11440 [Phycisphaerae bacterium]|nr:hypothetical protein [Phycisphaerae bacterium]